VGWGGKFGEETLAGGSACARRGKVTQVSDTPVWKMGQYNAANFERHSKIVYWKGPCFGARGKDRFVPLNFTYGEKSWVRL